MSGKEKKPAEGYRTLVVLGLQLAGYLLAWDHITEFIEPQHVALASVAVGIVMRIITRGPVGGHDMYP